MFALKSKHWGQTSSVLGGPYGVGSIGSLQVFMSLGSAEATVPGPSPLGTRSTKQCTSWGLVWPTILLVVWVLHDRGCSVGGTVLSSFYCRVSSSASPIPFPLVSSVTIYSPGPTPNIHSGSPCTFTISRSSWGSPNWGCSWVTDPVS